MARVASQACILISFSLFQYFKRECCISQRGEGHPNIQRCVGIVTGFAGCDFPAIVFKDVAVSDLQTFVFKNALATNMTKVHLVSLEFVVDRISRLLNLQCVGIDAGCRKRVGISCVLSRSSCSMSILTLNNWLSTRQQNNASRCQKRAYPSPLYPSNVILNNAFSLGS